MCAVDDNRPARRNNSSSSGGGSVIYHRSSRGEWSEPEEGERTGFTDTDRAWLPKRQHHALDLLCCSQSAKLSISLLTRYVLEWGKMSTHEPPEVIMCFKQHSYWQLASICACNVSRGWWCAALFLPYISLAFIHCGFTENECTKSLLAFHSHHQRVPCQGTANAFCLFPSMPRSQSSGS